MGITRTLVALIVLAIVAISLPMLLPRLGGHHVLAVEVPLDWAWRKGYAAGFVQVIASSPRGVVERTAYVEPGRGGLAQLEIPVDGLLPGNKAGWRLGDYVGLAAVYVNLYLYDSKGRLCVSAATLDTLDYLYQQQGFRREAWEEAARRPWLLLAAGKVHVPAERFTPCMPLGEVVHRLAWPRVAEALHETRPRPLAADETLPPGSMTVMVNQRLFEDRDHPPEAWLEHVVPRSSAAIAWRMFAERYSRSLLIPRDEASLPDALLYAARWYHLVRGWRTSGALDAVYGLVTMNDLLASLSGGLVSAGWADTYPRGSVLRHFAAAPLVEVRTACPTCSSREPPVVYASLGFGNYASFQAGVSVMGVMLLSFSRTTRSVNTEPLHAYLTGDDQAIYAPMDDVYVADGALVFLDVGTESIGGREYWVFTPVVAPLVLHYYRYDLLHTSNGPVDRIPGLRDALGYLLSQPGHDSIVTPEEVNVATLRFRQDGGQSLVDRLGETSVYSNALAGFAAYCANKLLWALAAAIIPPKYALVPDLASKIAGISIVDMRAAAMAFKIYVAHGRGGHTIELYARKYTLRYIDPSAFPQGNVYPTLVVYTMHGIDEG
jgi:hypothetical protein